jgi:hypothetical protein
MGLQWADVPSFLFPKKSITLTFERMVIEALGRFGDFLRRLGRVAT